MSETDADGREGSTVLVPIDAAEAETLPVALAEALAPIRIVVLGYYPVPSQAAPDQIRANREEEVTAAIEDVVARFADRGADVESVVVFTHDKDETIDRVADEYDVDAVLIPGDYAATLARVLVPIRGDENLERIVRFVGDLLGENSITVVLYNVAESDDEADRGESLLEDARDRLIERGIRADRIECRLDRGDSSTDAIVAAAGEFEMLIVGESEPSLRDRILGRTTGRVVERVERPVLVVRDA